MNPGILYVDQDREAQVVLPRFLQRHGTLRVAETLSAARASVNEELPAVVLIDPHLPDGDGIRLITEIRERHSWVQIFAMLDLTSSERVAEFIAAGANDVAVKPFDVGRLGARVAALMRAAETAHRETSYREQLESRLQHVGRLSTLGTLSATIAHEIANPLTLISADIEVLSAAFEGPRPIPEEEWQDLREAVVEMGVAARLIQSLIQRIRAFSRRDERRRVTESLEPIVDTALLLLKPRLSARTITVHRPKSQAPVVTHFPIRLTQALLNLLTNAIEAVAGGGNIAIRYIDEPNTCGIVVDDDGPGLGEEMRAHGNEPFFTSKVEGTGLGLFLVRTIMREHEGKFELSQNPSGRGVSARLVLPRSVDVPSPRI